MTSQIITQDLRALDQFSAIPSGHTGIIITNDRFAPHLRPGEIAVVDLKDKEPMSGELFVVGILNRHGQKEPRIVQTVVREEDDCRDGKWSTYLSCWDRYAFKNPDQISLADGPMTAEGWRANRCIGRIVGFVAPQWDLAPYRGDTIELGR